MDRSVLHMAGESREQFDAYVTTVCENGTACPLPVGAAAYASLHASILDSMTLAPGNTQDVPWLLEQPYVEILHLGLWLDPAELDAIADGAPDGAIGRLADELGSSGHRKLVRIGHEFDGPHNNFAPASYRRAFRHIAERLRPVDRTELVWHSYAWEPTARGEPIMSWYPGDDVVDWIGMTLFSFAGGQRPRSQLLDLVARVDRPVLLAECSPIRVAEVADARGDLPLVQVVRTLLPAR